jgi:hypothetical protein
VAHLRRFGERRPPPFEAQRERSVAATKNEEAEEKLGALALLAGQAEARRYLCEDGTKKGLAISPAPCYFVFVRVCLASAGGGR